MDAVVKFVNYRDKEYGIMIPAALISYIISIALENKTPFLPKTLSSSHSHKWSARWDFNQARKGQEYEQNDYANDSDTTT